MTFNDLLVKTGMVDPPLPPPRNAQEAEEDRKYKTSMHDSVHVALRWECRTLKYSSYIGVLLYITVFGLEIGLGYPLLAKKGVRIALLVLPGFLIGFWAWASRQFFSDVRTLQEVAWLQIDFGQIFAGVFPSAGLFYTLFYQNQKIEGEIIEGSYLDARGIFNFACPMSSDVTEVHEQAYWVQNRVTLGQVEGQVSAWSCPDARYAVFQYAPLVIAIYLTLAGIAQIVIFFAVSRNPLVNPKYAKNNIPAPDMNSHEEENAGLMQNAAPMPQEKEKSVGKQTRKSRSQKKSQRRSQKSDSSSETQSSDFSSSSDDSESDRNHRTSRKSLGRRR